MTSPARGSTRHAPHDTLRVEARLAKQGVVGENIIGVLFWRFDGTIEDANDAFLGAYGVECAAAALEEACAREEPVHRLQLLLDDVASHLHPVLDGLRDSPALNPAAKGNVVDP